MLTKPDNVDLGVLPRILKEFANFGDMLSLPAHPIQTRRQWAVDIQSPLVLGLLGLALQVYALSLAVYRFVFHILAVSQDRAKKIAKTACRVPINHRRSNHL